MSQAVRLCPATTPQDSRLRSPSLPPNPSPYLHPDTALTCLDEVEGQPSFGDHGQHVGLTPLPGQAPPPKGIDQ